MGLHGRASLIYSLGFLRDNISVISIVITYQTHMRDLVPLHYSIAPLHLVKSCNLK